MEEIRTGAVATTESVFGGQEQNEQPVSMPEPSRLSNDSLDRLPEPATVFGFAPEDEAEAAAPQQDDQQTDQTDANTGTQETAEADAAPAFRDERKRNAFQRQREELERKYRDDPARLIGERILKERMRRDGLDRNAALKVVNEKLDEAEAKTANVEPSMFRFMRSVSEKLGIGEDGTEEPQYGADARRGAEEPAGETPEDQAAQIVDDLMRVQLPRGFDLDAAVADPAFQELLVEYPAGAAVRIYQAEHMAPQRVADRLRARQGVPATTRPTQSVRPTPNYKEMSSDDFFRMKERVSKNIY